MTTSPSNLVYAYPGYPVTPPYVAMPVAAPVAIPAPVMAADTLVLSGEAHAAQPTVPAYLNQMAAYARALTTPPPAPTPSSPPALNPLGVDWVTAPASPAAAGTSLQVEWETAQKPQAPASSGPLNVNWVSGQAPEPAPKAEAPAPPAAPPPAPTVTVQPGDSLSAIAARSLGNAERWREIYDLNRDQLSNPNVIHAGQILKLPGGATPSAPAPKPSGINSNRDAVYLKQPNGWTCGPTSLTMAAAAFGVRPLNHATVDELTRLSRTRPEYGVPDSNALPDAARAIGLQAQYSARSTPASIRAALQRGHGVILNGSISGGVGHFLYIAGLNADGSFKICDPWRPGITVWNDAQLNQFAAGRGAIVEIWR